MYFFMIHIVFSSAASTNCFQVLYFAFLTFLLYSFRSFLYSFQSSLLQVLLCAFLAWFSSFLICVRSSFHHLLLKGDGFFLGVVSSIAFLTASTMSDAKQSMSASVAGVFFSSLTFIVFQSVFAKLYGGCVGSVIRGVRSRMVSTGRWSEPWSFSVAIWHFITLFAVCSFPHTRSIAVLAGGNVIVPGGIISCIPCSNIPSMSSSACVSRLMYCGGFQSGWCKLKSPGLNSGAPRVKDFSLKARNFHSYLP